MIDDGIVPTILATAIALSLVICAVTVAIIAIKYAWEAFND